MGEKCAQQGDGSRCPLPLPAVDLQSAPIVLYVFFTHDQAHTKPFFSIGAGSGEWPAENAGQLFLLHPYTGICYSYYGILSFVPAIYGYCTTRRSELNGVLQQVAQRYIQLVGIAGDHKRSSDIVSDDNAFLFCLVL